jgi:uncharacterized protein (DUF302 family)
MKMEKGTIDVTTVSIEHVTIRSNGTFQAVRARLENAIPRIDDGIFTLLRYGESDRALRELEALPALSIFGFRDHGALLRTAGLERRAILYDIGNPLTASRMTRHRISTALFAPVRVLLREDENGAVAFEFDRPASTFGQFEDNRVDPVARQLDRDLHAALLTAAC